MTICCLELQESLPGILIYQERVVRGYFCAVVSNTSRIVNAVRMCVNACLASTPKAVEVQVIRVEIKQGLLGVARPLGLQYRGAGRDYCGLSGRVDGFELKLRTHPESPVRASVGHNLHL